MKKMEPILRLKVQGSRCKVESSLKFGNPGLHGNPAPSLACPEFIEGERGCPTDSP
jgi:hypothetical protein